MRKMIWMFAAVLAVGAAVAAPPPPPKAGAPSPAKEGENAEGVIDPKADAALHRMSDYLAGLKTFKVDTVSVDEKISDEGQKIQELRESKLTVQRPGSLRVDRVGPNGKASLRISGSKGLLVNETKNVYATAAVPGTLDAVVDDVRERLNVEAPGGDFLFANSYNQLIDGVQVGRYIGLEPIEGVMAHHLAMTEKDVDWQVWIKDGAEAQPLRYVITSKDMTNQPQFTLQMSNWEPSAKVSADTFSVTPPKGATRVDPTQQAERPTH